MNHPELCQKYIAYLYHGVRISHQQANIDETYGEILPQSVSKLSKFLNLQSTDNFLDLGSGLAKVIIQLILQTKVGTTTGIEIIDSLHDQALYAVQKLQTEFPELLIERKLNLVRGNFLEEPWPNTTHVLIGSPCFSPLTLHAISKKIQATSSINTVISLRPLAHLTNFSYVKTLRFECSWDSALAFIYRINC